MKPITAGAIALGQMSDEDKQKFIAWVWEAKDINNFDPVVLEYPRTVMLRAGTEDDPLLYIPLQAVLMLESIAPKPGVTPRQEAMCLWRIGELVNAIAEQTGFREVYFLCKDDRVSDICCRHDFEELKGYRVMRRKLPANK